jgi:hypothetical protein
MNENEIKEDIGRIKDLIQALHLKYGDDLNVASVISVTCEETNHIIGSLSVMGSAEDISCTCCSQLLQSGVFLVSFFTAAKSAIAESDLGEFEKLLNIKTLECMEKTLVTLSDDFKKFMDERDIQESVQQLIDDVFKKGN